MSNSIGTVYHNYVVDCVFFFKHNFRSNKQKHDNSIWLGSLYLLIVEIRHIAEIVLFVFAKIFWSGEF